MRNTRICDYDYDVVDFWVIQRAFFFEREKLLGDARCKLLPLEPTFSIRKNFYYALSLQIQISDPALGMMMMVFRGDGDGIVAM